MIDWRIFYSDRTVFDSSMGEPEDAPPHGIIAVVQADRDCGRFVLNGWDWYYFDGTEWWGADLLGLLDRLMHNLPTRGVKQGRMASTDVWQEMMDRAVTDPDFPKKTRPHKRDRPFQQVGW